MKNQTLAYAIIASQICGVIAAIVEYDQPNTADSLYTLAGIGLYVFGAWAAFRLMNSEK